MSEWLINLANEQNLGIGGSLGVATDDDQVLLEEKMLLGSFSSIV